MQRWVNIAVLAILVIGCGKTSKPTPEATGSGTTTAGSDHAGGVEPQPVVAESVGTVSLSANDPFEQAITQLTALKGKMCACTDSACTAAVMEEYKLWRLEMKRATTGGKPTPDQDSRGNALDKELRACRATAEARAAGTAAGSATGSTGDPFDVALGELEAFKAKMCGCTDKPCTDRVAADVATWQRALRSKVSGKPSSLQEMRGKALEAEMKTCRAKAEAGTPGAPAGDKVDAMIAKLATFRDRGCACKDKACGEAIAKEILAWQQTLAKELADVKPTKDQDTKFEKLGDELKACVAKL
jgi:hypothetical protein